MLLELSTGIDNEGGKILKENVNALTEEYMEGRLQTGARQHSQMQAKVLGESQQVRSLVKKLLLWFLLVFL